MKTNSLRLLFACLPPIYKVQSRLRTCIPRVFYACTMQPIYLAIRARDDGSEKVAARFYF